MKLNEIFDFDDFNCGCHWREATGLSIEQCKATGDPCIEVCCGPFSMIMKLIELNRGDKYII